VDLGQVIEYLQNRLSAANKSRQSWTLDDRAAVSTLCIAVQAGDENNLTLAVPDDTARCVCDKCGQSHNPCSVYGAPGVGSRE